MAEAHKDEISSSVESGANAERLSDYETSPQTTESGIDVSIYSDSCEDAAEGGSDIRGRTNAIMPVD